MSALKKNQPCILIYGLAGSEPSKEIEVLLYAIKELGGTSVLVTERESDLGTLADYFYINPSWDFEKLLQIARQHNTDLALLGTDFASPLVGRLNDTLQLPGPSEKQYDQISDKLNWTSTGQAYGLKFPKQAIVRSREELLDLKWDFPFIVKPTKSTGNVDFFGIGYRYFNSTHDFIDFLESSGKADKFFAVSNHGGPLGRYMLQEQIHYKSWKGVYLTIVNGKVYRHEVGSNLFWPYPHKVNYYATYAPVQTTDLEKEHMDKVEKILTHDLKILNTSINYDLITSHDDLCYSIDINPRCSGTFAIVSEDRQIPYFQQCILAFLGQDFDFNFQLKPYLRRTLTFDPGFIRKITWPKEYFKNLRLLGEEKALYGIHSPPYPGRFTFPLETIITGEDLESCFEVYKRFSDTLALTYEEKPRNNEEQFNE